MTATFLFVPGDDRRKIEKSRTAGADVVLLDLEDAVAEQHKDRARRTVTAELQRGGWDGSVGVRVNGQTSPWFAADVEAVAPLSEWLAVPKIESHETATNLVQSVHSVGVRPRVIALLESASGVLAAADIASVPGLQALMFGSGDYCADMGIRESKQRVELDYPRAHVALAAASRRLLAIDTPFYQDLRDHRAALADAQRARQLGYRAKAAIHPAHVPVIRRAFHPAPAEIEWARTVLQAHASSRGGAARVGDTMIDRPVLTQARAVLERAQESPQGGTA